MDTCNPNNDTTSDRDEKGRFRKGNRGGPGNPFTRRMAKLRQVALDSVTDDDIRAAIDALKQKAREGDVAAIKLLLSYTVGKPAASPDPDTLDLHEIKTILANHAQTEEDMFDIVNGMPAELLTSMLHAMLPGLLESKRRSALETLSAADEDEEDEDEAGGVEPVRDIRNIPGWLLDLVRADRNAAESARQASCGSQLPPEAGGNGLPPTKADVELLRALLARIATRPPGSEDPPIANGSNGQSSHPERS
jgi:hypothetical protein